MKLAEAEARQHAVESPQLVRQGDVVQIQKPHATFTIYYEYHPLFGVIEVPQKRNKLPQSTSALVIETGTTGTDYVADPLGKFENARRRHRTVELFEHAQDQRIPLAFADVQYQLPRVATQLHDAIPLALETFIGGTMIAKVAERVRDKNPTRRDIVKGAAGVWLLTPVASKVGRMASSISGVGEAVTAAGKKISNTIHPELGVLLEVQRNVVYAEKEDWWAQQLGGNPNIVTSIGSDHAGLESEFTYTSEQRLEFLRKLRPYLKQIVHPDMFYSIAVYEFDGNKWNARVIEVPQLKEIMQ